MTAANSFTGTIKTDGELVTIESVTVGVTGSNFTGFTTDKKYTFQVQNTGYIKISDAEFCLSNQFMYWKATSDTPYIKTLNDRECVLTILEDEESA